MGLELAFGLKPAPKARGAEVGAMELSCRRALAFGPRCLVCRSIGRIARPSRQADAGASAPPRSADFPRKRGTDVTLKQGVSRDLAAQHEGISDLQHSAPDEEIWDSGFDIYMLVVWEAGLRHAGSIDGL